MPKVFEDSLGNLEYLLLGLTFVGVLYLVMKEAKLTVSKESMYTSGAGTRFNIMSDASNVGRYDPAAVGREGMGSMSAHEPPSWHQTAHDPSELDLVAFEQSAAGVDYNELSGKRDFAPNTAVSGAPTVWDTAGQEGMRGYARAAVRQGMQDKLAASMLGANTAL